MLKVQNSQMNIFSPLLTFRYYVIGIIICPMLFYLPKFFELKTVYSKIGFDYVVDCVSLLSPPKLQSGGEYIELFSTNVLDVHTPN